MTSQNGEQRARILTDASGRDIASEMANETIVDMFEYEVGLVEQWLQKEHPELIDDSGRTCWGVLIAKLSEEES